jgi:hypothetical protein
MSRALHAKSPSVTSVPILPIIRIVFGRVQNGAQGLGYF